MTQANRKKLVMKLLSSLVGAWLVATGFYFLTLFVLDFFVGARQLNEPLAQDAYGRLLRNMIAVFLASATVALPVITAWGLAVIAIARSRFSSRTVLAILAGISLLVATLLSLQFSLLEVLPFAAGFAGAMFFIQLLWTGE